MYSSDDKAVCRGCGLVLRGKPAWAGGLAFHPRTGEECPRNYFGGFVCSESCDRRAYLEQEQSMPGHSGQQHIDPHTSARITAKWSRQ